MTERGRTTRLLVLGVVHGHGTASGYQVGTTLQDWGVSEWANVKWGSIYHALRGLVGAGFLAAHEVGGRTDHRLTPSGEREFLDLLRDALRHPEPRPDALGAALILLPAVSRAEARELLRERRATCERWRDDARARAGGWTGPPHFRELFGLWERTASDGEQWICGLISRLDAGAYRMAGDPTPARSTDTSAASMP